MKLINLIFFISLFSYFTPYSAKKTLEPHPRIYSFFKSDYKAERQNWDVDNAKSGAIYFANSLGLLRYDGEDWQLYKTPNTARALLCKGDTIFVGGDGFIGYFIESDIKNDFQLLRKLDTDIWKIYSFNDDVIFQSFDRLYFLNPDGNFTKQFIIDGNTTFSYPHNNKIFFQRSYDDLLQFSNNELSKIDILNDDISKYLIKAIIPLDENKLMLGTLNHGIYILEDSIIQPLNKDLNSILKKSEINKIIAINDNKFAIATLNSGVIIIDEDGKIKYHINSAIGLTNDRVHGIDLQDNRLLWMTTEDGISFIDLQSSVRILHNKTLHLGAYNDICEIGDKRYFASNAGLFEVAKNTNKNLYKTLLSGQVVNLDFIDNTLWIGHNNATYTLQNGTLNKISNIAGGYSFIRSKINPNIIYQSSYFGLAIYLKTNNSWSFSFHSNAVNELTRDIFELPDGSILVGCNNNNIFRVYIDLDNKKATAKALNLGPKLNNSSYSRIFNIDSKAIIMTDSISYFYQDDSLTMCPEAYNGACYISPAIKQHIFIRKNNELLLYNYEEDKTIHTEYPLNNIGNSLIYKYENIINIDNNSILFCIGDEIATSNISTLLKDSIKHTLTRLTNISLSNNRNGTTSTFEDGKDIPYELNSIAFRFSCFRYDQDSNYEYKLKGYQDEWLVTNNNSVQFQNLPNGNFTFQVRGVGEKNYASQSFVVSPPFHKTPEAYILYVVTVILFVCISIYLIELNSKRVRYKQKVRNRHRIREQRINNQRLQLDGEVKRLQTEVSDNNGKVTNLLLQNTKKKEVIDKINDELITLKDNSNNLSTRQVEGILRLIRLNFDEKKDWDSFEMVFNEAHSGFFKNLKIKHPSLSKDDLHLCAYLKVELTSKELAPILGITTRSVDLKKYRLKKKLGLNKEQSLGSYIQSIV